MRAPVKGNYIQYILELYSVNKLRSTYMPLYDRYNPVFHCQRQRLSLNLPATKFQMIDEPRISDIVN